jgi:hypothetical protein
MPSVSVKTLAPVVWSPEVETCSSILPLPACGSGEVCAPESTAPFMGACIYQPGNVACPPGTPYVTRQLVYSGTSDSRGCGACTCGSPRATCSGGTVAISNDPTCAVSPTNPNAGNVPLPTPPPCAQTQLAASAVYVKLTTPPNASGSCSPSGGQPTGTAMPTLPVTVCCP